MPHLVLAALLAVLAAAPARAQTAADSALVEAVLDAAQVEEMMDAMLGPLAQGMLPDLEQVFQTDALEDSLRARLIADGRSADLREILAFLESPASQQMMDHGRRLLEQAADPAQAAALGARVEAQNEKTLADEALTRRLIRAQGMGEQMPEMMRRVFGAMAEAVPQMAAEMKAGGGLDAFTATFESQVMRDFEQTQVNALRAAYYGLPDTVLAETAAFYESPAGQYFTSVSTEAAMDVVIPAVARFFARMASDQPPPPPMPSGPEPEIFEVAEVQPELIGGIDALAAAVVYPEAARQAGVEGTVVVQFVVNERGKVVLPEVVRSPSDLLSEAAVAAVRRQRFTPGQVRGQPVKVRFAVPVVFRLTDPETVDGRP